MLPTGAGKTFLATQIIHHLNRSALVVAPTIDLLHQWYARLGNALGLEVGVYYGAEKVVKPLTVTTYHSAGDLLAVHQNAFISALYSKNQFVLGDFVNHERFAALLSERLTRNRDLLNMMQDAGLIREDVDVSTSAWVALIFRQGMLTTSIGDIGQEQTDFESILNQFVAMFHQFTAVSSDHPNEAGKAVLKRYIDELKAQLPPNVSA